MTATARRLSLPALSERGILLGLLAGALALRSAASGRSLWLDETISLIQVDRPLLEVISRQVDGVHPPLYHVLLHTWSGALGSSPLALRGLSIAWSLVAIAAIWAWSREAFPGVSAVPAAAFAAFAPFTVWYATEVRMYAQLLALTALSGWLAWSVMGRPRAWHRYAALCAALVALLYTHYFATLFVGSLGLVAVVVAATRIASRRGAAAVVGSCAAAFALLGPWLAWVAVHREARPLTTVFRDPDFFTALIAGLEMLIGFHSFALLGLLAAGWPLLCLIALAVVRHTGAPSWRGSGLAVLLLLPPLVLIAVSLLAPRSAFDSRYLTVCAAPLYLLAGRAFADLPGRRVRVALALALAAAGMATAVWQNYDRSNPKLYELREAMASVNEFGRPGDALMLVPQVNELGSRDPVLNYYRPAAGLRVVDTSLDGGPAIVAPPDMWRRLRATRPERVFVVYGFNALTYSSQSGVLTGGGLSSAYDSYLADRSRMVGSLRYANVTLRVYAPSWRKR